MQKSLQLSSFERNLFTFIKKTIFAYICFCDNKKNSNVYFSKLYPLLQCLFLGSVVIFSSFT